LERGAGGQRERERQRERMRNIKRERGGRELIIKITGNAVLPNYLVSDKSCYFVTFDFSSLSLSLLGQCLPGT
jgi:hypothetical protein